MGKKENINEQKLINLLEESGGRAFKFSSIYVAGMPDRLLVAPGGRIAWCEVKAPGEKLRKLQEQRKIMLEGLGCIVFVVSNDEELGKVEDWIYEV